MFERLDAPTNRADAELNRDQPKVLTLRPLIDREVPLLSAVEQPMGDMPAVVQQWLDGNASERTARRSDDGSVELWNRIAEETRRRNRMETPAYMSGRIMAVLPKKAPSKTAALFRPFGVKPATVMASGAGLLAAGIALGEWLLH